MAVTSMVVGAVTPAGATFACKVTGGGPVRVAVADNAGMAAPVFTASQAVDAQGVAKVSITGLDPNTRHWWRTEDNGVIDTGVTGQLVTDPPAGLPASFTVGAASCAGLGTSFPGSGSELAPDRISNHPVFGTIRTRAQAENWRRFANLGDLHYYDLGSGSHGIIGGGSLANYRAGYDDVLAQSNQAQLYREVPLEYVWDDHDFGPNDSDGTLATKGNALQVYGERVPHRTLDGGNGIYQSWEIGRVLFVASDVRFSRSPNGDLQSPSKTMLGSAQKSWLDGMLGSSEAKFFVWLMASQWIGSSTDGWASFTHERDELVQMLGDHGWLGRMCMVYGDRHAAGIDSGGSNLWGGFPILQAASLDSDFGLPIGGQFDVLDDTPGRNQYGTIAVQDLGTVMSVTLAAWSGTSQLGAHQFGLSVSDPAPPASGALLRTLTGSHTPVFEARVVTGHPTGDDPEGVAIPVVGGDVTLDGTAEIRGSLQLETLGVDNDTGLSTFPRLSGDLLGPYGAELFVRYGLDLGGSILWTPLGYYRIVEPDQGDAPYGGIGIAGEDRMAGIVEADLLAPRSYAAERTVGSVVQELVSDIYPGAVIVWDDSSDQTPLGRVLVADQSRYEVIKEVADSAGKILYWDGEGILRIETAPEETAPVWEVRSGRNGVLVSTSRSISRRDVNNAIILTGAAADDTPAVRATAIDNNPQSPTYFRGDFGQVPRSVESTLVSTIAQAQAAAIATLRRSLGAPYQVTFGAVVNPTLQPWDPVRVTYRDGNRDIVVLQRVAIPLAVGVPMTGTARTRLLATIGSLA